MRGFPGLASLALAAAVALVLGTAVAAAQTAPPVLPGSADPGRLQERVSPQPFVETTPTMEIPNLGLAPVAPRAGQQSFVLKSVTLDGATAIAPGALETLYKSFIGREVTISDLQTIANAITQYYRDRGYFLTRAFVPEQTVSEGTIHITVLEGYVSDVRFEFADGKPLGHDWFGILEQTRRAILAMRPASGPELERRLLLISDLRGVKASPVLEPLADGKGQPGAVGMVIKLAPAGPSISVKADNYGSRYTGPYEAMASVQFSPGLFAFDNLTLSGLISVPPDEAKYVSANYAVPVNADGTKVSLSGEYSKSNPGFTLKPYGVDGDFYRFSLGVSHPVIRSRSTNLFLNASFDVTEASTDALSTELYRDSLRVFRFGGQFNYADNFGGTTQADLTFSQGLDILGARRTGSLNLSRAGGHSDFSKVVFDLSRLQKLTDDWDFYAAASGQYAADALLVSEQFGFGGQAFGRAYDPSELIGDSGVSGTAELRFNGIPAVQGMGLQPFGFVDAGKVWQRSVGSNYGESAGVGVHLNHDSGLEATVGVAFPLRKTGLGTGDDPRLLAQIGFSL